MPVLYMFQCGHVNGGPGRLSPLWRGFRDSPADRQQQRRGLAPAVLRVSYHRTLDWFECTFVVA